jgi:PadR family transcriptional regulator AphA
MILEFLILGMLKDSPRSGYDLGREFKHIVSHFWQAHQSQVYRALYRLEREGWVRSIVVKQQVAPDKKIYRITRKGRTALTQWLKNPVTTPALRRPWLGQLFFADEMSAEEIVRIIDRRLAELKREYDELRIRMRGGSWNAHLREALRKRKRISTRGLTLAFGVESLGKDIELLEMMRDSVRQSARMLEGKASSKLWRRRKK